MINKESSILTHRVLILMQSKTMGSKHLKMIEGLTGVSSERWKAISAKKQNVTIDILEIVCKTWPQHAFWLMTGVEDAAGGHIAPLVPVIVGTTRVNALVGLK